MAAYTQALAAWRALKTSLDARAALDGVGFFSAHPGDNLPPEAVVLLGFVADQEWAAIGRQRKDEEFTLRLSIYKQLPRADEAVILAVQDRILAIQAEIEDQLSDDPTITSTVRVARVSQYELTQGYGDAKRWAEMRLDVVAQVRLTNT